MISVCWPNTMLAVRRIAAEYFQPGEVRVYDLDLVADAAHADPRAACSVAGWAEISTDGGANYTPLGSSEAGGLLAGVSLGAFTAGQRRTVKVRVTAPADTGARSKSLNLVIGGE